MKKRTGNIFLFVTIAVDIALVILIVFFMNYVQYLINEDVRINLTEIVSQNKDVISSRLTLEINNIELSAKQISDDLPSKTKLTHEKLKNTFLEYAKAHDHTEIIWADETGQATTTQGVTVDISSRSYFRLGMDGIKNISQRITSKSSGEDAFVICVPVLHNDSVVGIVAKEYTPQKMSELFAFSLFAEKGYTHIINKDGYIMFSSIDDEITALTDSYYRMLYESSPKDAKLLQDDISAGKSGFMETKINGKRVFSAFTPLEQVYDWYLITSVETSAVSPNSQIAITIFYFILGVLIILFSMSILYYVAQRRKKQQQLERIAFIDPVTTGITLAKFELDAKKIISSNHDDSLYICTLDIDSFKYINSFYGFEAGDKILKSIYIQCSEKLTEDELIGRVHSDHFIMLLKDISPNRLASLLQAEQIFGSISIYISAGIYKITDKSEPIGLMHDKASLAAQKVKGKRYDKISFYSDEFDRKLIQDEQIKRSVETALQNDEIIPFFQPKIDSRTREVKGAEALARWKKPDGKMVYPSDFIPVCEKSGLITSVDMKIFESTLKFIKHCLNNNIICPTISVNFSRLHLLDGNFIQKLLELLNKYQVPPGLIELELTETIIFENSEHINQFIDKIHSQGLKISMDDFGTGYSSLHMLKDIDIDVLKIDRGFLLETTDNEKQMIVFGTIVELAQKLDISIVVEGVETEENLALANEFGCNIIQGYYYSKPVESETFLQMCKDKYI